MTYYGMLIVVATWYGSDDFPNYLAVALISVSLPKLSLHYNFALRMQMCVAHRQFRFSMD